MLARKQAEDKDGWNDTHQANREVVTKAKKVENERMCVCTFQISHFIFREDNHSSLLCKR